MLYCNTLQYNCNCTRIRVIFSTSRCFAACLRQKRGLIDYEKILFMKCTKRIDDMGAPCVTPSIQCFHHLSNRSLSHVHFINLNAHKLLIYNVSSNILFAQIDSFFPINQSLLSKNLNKGQIFYYVFFCLSWSETCRQFFDGYKKMLFMKCSNSIDDMGAPCITSSIQGCHHSSYRST